jgi:ribosomal protein S3
MAETGEKYTVARRMVIADAAIRDAVRRSIERAVGLSAVDVDLTADRVHVTIRAARPGVAWGLDRAAETEGVWRETAAERLRRELQEVTGGQVRLDILQVPGPQEMPEGEGRGLLSG